MSDEIKIDDKVRWRAAPDGTRPIGEGVITSVNHLRFNPDTQIYENAYVITWNNGSRHSRYNPELHEVISQ